MARTKKRLIWTGLALSVVLAGCQASTDDILSLREHAPLPKDALDIMKAKGMTRASPIMIRIFKEEEVLEIWKQQDTGRYSLVKTYEICAYSGKKGPKFKEGDRQAPEGFYFVGRSQMNPRSSYHLSFNLGFPNAYDRSHGRTGSHLMVHGDCSSAGCYAMTDEGISEIYAFARDALRYGLQDQFQVQAFPFRMTPENMARFADHEYFDYWTMLKQGYDHFELTKQPPKVDVCEKRYVFNMQAEDEFVAAAQCPEMSMPENLAVAYQRMQAEHQTAFQEALAALNGGEPQPVEPLQVDVPQPAQAVPAPVPTEAAAVVQQTAQATVADGAFPPPPTATAAATALPLPEGRP